MLRTDSLLVQQEWRVIDQSSMGPQFPATESFAMDDTLCALAGAGKTTAVARAWVHHHTVVLGIQDTKLPHLKQGIEVLKEHQYQAIVRNSGGLAVVLDKGVLNLSLVFPETSNRIEINRGYDTMFDLVKLMFEDFHVKIEAKEIVGSYCPGSYDLSIAGRKFAGISQRRIRNGVAVQIYLCVNESGRKRAQMIKDFYEAALNGAQTKFTYPEVQPEVMASLSELLQAPLTVADVMQRFLHVLQENSEHINHSALTEEEYPLYESYLTRIKERNETSLPQ